MKAILFLDDWMVEHRDSLERVWGKPELVKELFTDFYPGYLGYGGYMTVFHDEQVGRYVLYLAVFPPEADPGVFVVRLESDDPYEWPHPVYDAQRRLPRGRGSRRWCWTSTGSGSGPSRSDRWPGRR